MRTVITLEAEAGADEALESAMRQLLDALPADSVVEVSSDATTLSGEQGHKAGGTGYIAGGL